MSTPPKESPPDSRAHSRAKGLVERYYIETNNEESWLYDHDHFIQWMQGLAELTKRSTFEVYRRWLASYAVSCGDNLLGWKIGRVNPAPYDEPHVVEVDQAQESTPKANDYENQLIASELTKKHLAKLSECLLRVKELKSTGAKKYKYKSGHMAMQFITLTISTGLRPSEWRTARLLQEVEHSTGVFRFVLEVDTSRKGKISNEGLPLTRRLVLDGLQEDQLHLLKTFLATIPDDPKEFDKLYHSVRSAISRASVDAGFPYYVTLYTFRHFFASEIRREGLETRYGLAAMLGHSDTVNQAYYGDLSPDQPRVLPMPLAKSWPDATRDVERVDRRRYKLIYSKSNEAYMADSFDDGPINVFDH